MWIENQQRNDLCMYKRCMYVAIECYLTRNANVNALRSVLRNVNDDIINLYECI